jgi:hypothetical protein
MARKIGHYEKSIHLRYNEWTRKADDNGRFAESDSGQRHYPQGFEKSLGISPAIRVEIPINTLMTGSR